jgi:hypothetical protein
MREAWARNETFGPHHSFGSAAARQFLPGSLQALPGARRAILAADDN